jgi:hypothetical protein
VYGSITGIADVFEQGIFFSGGADKHSLQNDTDMAIIMTARPSPEVSISGFATCLQSDQFSRCTVGQFNWVPDVLDIINANSDHVIRSDRHTAAHEIAHLLGEQPLVRVVLTCAN